MKAVYGTIRPPDTLAQKFLKTQPLAKLARRTSIATVGICFFLVAFMVATKVLFTDEVVATDNLRHLAKIYYEDYYYYEFASNRSGATLATAFEPYNATGFRAVTLRQLLSFDNNRYASAADRFSGCDALSTTAKITPVPPYGVQDYQLETTLVCNQ